MQRKIITKLTLQPLLSVIGGIIMSMFLRKNKNKKKKAVPTCLILNDKCKYPTSVSCEQCYIKQEVEKESGEDVR